MHSTRTRLRPRFNGWISSASFSGEGAGFRFRLVGAQAAGSSWLRGALLGCLGVATTLGALLAGTGGLQNAVANGDTRTLSLYHAHTRESLTVTFRRNGRYDRAELQKLNWFLRDWRNDEAISMDPKLFDIVWAAQREVGSRGTVRVLSAYRSPKTNAMLRRRSSAVAKNSQHVQGRALDFQLPDADMGKVRAVGMRLQRGGVGYYPNVPFVHLDSGSVRSWPRMPRNQLERLFPDGRTVHLPADGRPLAGYDAAKKMILARGDAVPGVSAAAVADAARQPERRRSLWAALFGGGADEAEDADVTATSSRRQVASRGTANQVAQNDDDNDPRRFFLVESRNATANSRAAAQAAAQQAAAQQAAAQAAAQAGAQAQAQAQARAQAEARAAAAAQQAAPAAPPGRPVQILPNIPVVAPQPVDTRFTGPMPVARPAMPAPAAPVAEPPAPTPTVPALIAALPPPRPGAPVAAPAPEAPTMVASAIGSGIPVPPTRPAELAPALAADRNALAAIAAASGAWGEGPADASIQTAALAYAPAPATARPPLPPLRPRQGTAAASAVRVSPSLPPAANDERRALMQLFASVATESKPSPRAQVRTARVVAAAPPARVPAPVTSAAPAVVVQMEFTRDNATDLTTDSFSGPAVKPLPVARFGQ